MSEHIDSVKSAAEYLRGIAAKNADKEAAHQRLTDFAIGLEKAAEHFLHLEGLTSALPPELGNIHDLPQELLGELSVAKTDELEDQIVTVINACGGEASLDQILVGLFRKFKVVQKRRFLQNKLYRMSMVWSVDGRKGHYTTKEPENDFEKMAREALEYSSDELDDDVPF